MDDYMKSTLTDKLNEIEATADEFYMKLFVLQVTNAHYREALEKIAAMHGHQPPHPAITIALKALAQ